MRRKALARWENEGGADRCGSQVPGVAKDCGDKAAEPGEPDGPDEPANDA